MKENTIYQKHKIIKLFFSGLSYDEIAMQVGVAKGSVVNVVNEFRDGALPVPPGMTEYIDDLRKIAVDMKKHGTTVTKLQGDTKLHAKIKGMGVGKDEVEQWLDICQGIATTAVPNSAFVSAALELAQLTALTGKDYKALMADYKAKLQATKGLEDEIKQKKGQLADIVKKATKEKGQATKELDAITKAIATAQEIFSQQKKELKQQLDEYMAQHKLSWDTVKVVAAIIESGLGDAGLDEEQKTVISKRIAKAGSLTIYTKDLEHTQKIMTEKVGVLEQQQKSLTDLNGEQKSIKNELARHLLAETYHQSELDTQIGAKSKELAKITEVVSGYGRDLYAAWLVLGFLFNPNRLSDFDFDQLVQLMVGIRQYRLKIAPKKVKNATGKVICECLVSEFQIPESEYGSSLEEAKRRLALYLIPLVKEKFMPKFEYEAKQLSQSIVQTYGDMLDVIAKCAGLPGNRNTPQRD
ncbi:coiled-coil domain-containing protein [Chloroflexota bacterium]